MKRYAAIAATVLVCLGLGVYAQTPPEPARPLNSATQTSYDNTTSGLASTTVQGALGEVASLVADGTGVSIGNRATGGMIYNQCDEGSTSAIEVLAGANAAFVTFIMAVDGSEQGFFKVESPWGAYDFQPLTHTLWPSAPSPVITTTLTSGLFTAALSTDAAAFNVAAGLTSDPITVYVAPGMALHIYSPVNNCWTVDVGIVVAEVQP